MQAFGSWRSKYDNVELLDLYPLFATAEGQPQLQLLATDRLHIGQAGYEVLGRALKAEDRIDESGREWIALSPCHSPTPSRHGTLEARARPRRHSWIR